MAIGVFLDPCFFDVAPSDNDAHASPRFVSTLLGPMYIAKEWVAPAIGEEEIASRSCKERGAIPDDWGDPLPDKIHRGPGPDAELDARRRSAAAMEPASA